MFTDLAIAESCLALIQGSLNVGEVAQQARGANEREERAALNGFLDAVSDGLIAAEYLAVLARGTASSQQQTLLAATGTLLPKTLAPLPYKPALQLLFGFALTQELVLKAPCVGTFDGSSRPSSNCVGTPPSCGGLRVATVCMRGSSCCATWSRSTRHFPGYRPRGQESCDARKLLKRSVASVERLLLPGPRISGCHKEGETEWVAAPQAVRLASAGRRPAERPARLAPRDDGRPVGAGRQRKSPRGPTVTT